MRQQSQRQRQRERKLHEQKRDRIRAEIELRGFAMCERCGRGFASEEDAMAGLQGHHKKHRGMGASFNRDGIDDPDNLLFLCALCHRREHY